MNIDSLTSALAVAVLFSATVPALATGDAAAGKENISACKGCHGIPGYRTAFPSVYNVPKLGGQHAEYIVKALQAYKSGERSHPTMRAVAAGLSDQDMANLAAYYAAQDANPTAK